MLSAFGRAGRFAPGPPPTLRRPGRFDAGGLRGVAAVRSLAARAGGLTGARQSRAVGAPWRGAACFERPARPLRDWRASRRAPALHHTIMVLPVEATKHAIRATWIAAFVCAQRSLAPFTGLFEFPARMFSVRSTVSRRRRLMHRPGRRLQPGSPTPVDGDAVEDLVDRHEDAVLQKGLGSR